MLAGYAGNTITRLNKVNYSSLIQGILGSEGVSGQAAAYQILAITGPDAVDYLQRLCSQDVLGMAAGESRPAAFLNAKGKLLHLCTLIRQQEGDGVYVEFSKDQAKGLADLLELYHFSEQLTLQPAKDWGCVELFSLQAMEKPGATDAGLVVSGQQGDVYWQRLHGDVAQAVEYKEMKAEQAEALRICMLRPRLGVDTEANTLALELPIADHIALEKGCYTGQEIVARIHTYGHTNRALCSLLIEGRGEVAAQTPLLDEDDEAVGRVMSVAPVPGEDLRVALGYLPTVLTESGTELQLAEAQGPRVQVL